MLARASHGEPEGSGTSRRLNAGEPASPPCDTKGSAEMKRTSLALGLFAVAVATPALAAEGPVPQGIPHLDHVFVVMMENHGYSQIINNPNAPFINKYAKTANLGTNYFAIAHPSSTNYLEIVGGSNFGVHTDNFPDWHNATCSPNLATGMTSTDTPASPPICPIAGTGIDAETPAVDL